MTEVEFLVMIRDKIDILSTKVAVREPLLEISAMITARIAELQKGGQP